MLNKIGLKSLACRLLLQSAMLTPGRHSRVEGRDLRAEVREIELS